MSLNRQRGIALLVAIIMFALATTVAAAITYNKAMAARRAAATFTLEQALQAGMAAEALAGIVLENNATKTTTTPNDDWAKPLGPVELEGTGIWIAAQVEDAGGRFNLNSVVKWDPSSAKFIEDPVQVEIFRTILSEFNIDLRYADLLVDWIDTDNQVTGTSGGEDTLYLSQNPPYRPPNTFISHSSELLALPGFGAQNYAKIAPFVTAVPVSARVNLCTASGLVLDATLNDPSNATQYRTANLEQMRAKNCWPDTNTYAGVIADPAQQQAAKDRVYERSDWFRLRTHIRVGTAEFVLYSVLYREPSANKVRTVQRSFGSE